MAPDETGEETVWERTHKLAEAFPDSDIAHLLAEIEELRGALRDVVAAYDALAFDCEMGNGAEAVTRARALLND